MEARVSLAVADSPAPPAPALVPAHRHALGLFLRHLAQGERVAQQASARQAAIAPTPRIARFLRSQARQERTHAMLFDSFARALGAAPLALRECPYRAYSARVGAAADRGDFLETVVGTQIVLEALGEILLARLDHGIARRGDALRRLRRRILAQEATHHAFGVAIVAAALEPGSATRDAVRGHAHRYSAFAARLIDAGAPALGYFGVTATALRAELAGRLGHWSAAC